MRRRGVPVARRRRGAVSSGANLRRSAALVSAVAAAALAPTAASAGTVTLGGRGWQVLSSARVKSGGATVSSPRYPASAWLHVRPDGAGAAGTDVNALVQ